MNSPAPIFVRLGMRLPVIQGPFGGGLSTVGLAATVTNAGGMGSYGAHLLEPEEIVRVTADIRAATRGPFVINLWVNREDPAPPAVEVEFGRAIRELDPLYRKHGVAPPVFAEPGQLAFERQAEAVLRAGPPVFSFVFGIPSPEILDDCRRRGIATMGAATTLDEALAVEAAGADLVLATGFEAGGHRPSFLRPAADSLHGTLALVRQVAAAVKIPVVAAGGIADAPGVAAALAAGAGAVQVGTAFLACEESGASTEHRRRLFEAAARHTRLSDRVSGRLARFMVTPMLDELEASLGSPLGYPLQGELTKPLRSAGGGLFYAGQGAPLLRHRHAAELTRDLAGLAPPCMTC